ncbi:hypothetical protein [Epilithonimonas mollis]|nr:hypothetical protein [Epilithonimonas mollis]
MINWSPVPAGQGLAERLVLVHESGSIEKSPAGSATPSPFVGYYIISYLF